MSDVPLHASPKVHPATREILPDDPLEMTGFEMDGDRELMLQMLVEEYARIGWGVDDIMRLARDPEYLAFHGLLQSYGAEALSARVSQILSRCGVMRVKTKETQPLSERLVQIDPPTT